MIALLGLVLSIAPWSGKDLPTSTSSAAKYRLTVAGTPGSTVHLRTSRVANGWIAAFCNNRICSPNAIEQSVPASGTLTLQFELIREETSAPHVTAAVIHADGDARPVTVRVRR